MSASTSQAECPSPKINKRYLFTLLCDGERGFTPKDLRYMGRMVILAAAQHKVELAYMVDLTAEVFSMCDTLDSIERACALRATLQNADPERKCEWFDQAVITHITEVNAVRRKLAGRIKTLLECPEPEDTVH